ncbi:hypothetical protein ACGFJ7_45580 [Actinoplanes sp. NPDC048988]|uniref:hypothetical protein n=1 Tax=Actinoplanes sp. NPDC048988 TaxID=3363901 RepID=UPI0037116B65
MPDCSNGDAIYFGAFGGFAELLDSGIDGILRKIASSIMNAAASLFAQKVPTLSPDGEMNHKIGLQTNWLVVTIAVASLLFAAVRMALEMRSEAGMIAIKGLLRLMVTAGAGTFVIGQLALLSDTYTTHLYEAGVQRQLQSIASCDNGGIATFLLIIIGLLLIISGIIHIILLYIRLGVMVLLVGTLPMAASASMTNWGSSWWRKHIAWLAAWLIYKPAVGLILYVGTTMIGYSGNNATQQKIAGCGVLLLSAVALPGLLRLVVPAAAALGSSDGAASAASSAAGATGSVLTAAGRSISGGGRSGSAGRSRPSGAPTSKGGAPASNGGASGKSGMGGRAAAGAARGVGGALGGAAQLLAKAGNSTVKHATNVASGAVSGGRGDEH